MNNLSWLRIAASRGWIFCLALLLVLGGLTPDFAFGADGVHGEADLVLPDLSKVQFFGMPGTYLLYGGLLVCLAGLAFGMMIFGQLKRMDVHSSMLEVSELIY